MTILEDFSKYTARSRTRGLMNNSQMTLLGLLEVPWPRWLIVSSSCLLCQTLCCDDALCYVFDDALGLPFLSLNCIIMYSFHS